MTSSACCPSSTGPPPCAWLVSPTQKRRLRRARKHERELALKEEKQGLLDLAAYASSIGRRVSVRDLSHIYATSLQASDSQQARDSRLIQRLLWALVENHAWSDDILTLIDKDIVSMSLDKNWNFMVQHIVTLCDPAQLDVICLRLRGQADRLARHRIGCRVLCRVCEQTHTSSGARALLLELSDKLLTYLEDENANFVISKLLENFDYFPGLDEVLFVCAQKPDKSHFVICCLANACELQRLKARHFEALLAWPGLSNFQDGRVQEKIIYEAAQLHSQLQEQSGNAWLEEERSELSTRTPGGGSVKSATSWELSTSEHSARNPAVPAWCLYPVYVNLFDPAGSFLGCFHQGYQAVQVIHPLPDSETSCAPDDSPGSMLSREMGSSPKATLQPSLLTWDLSKRNAKRLHKNSPTVLHLGKSVYGGCIFGMDLVTLLEASTAESLFYKAALKLLEGPTLKLNLTFNRQLPSVCHDFSEGRVCISPVMEIPLETLLDPEGTLVLSVDVSVSCMSG